MKPTGTRYRSATHAAGFTLIEIMIVVAIIALISAIAMPSILRARQLSRRVALMRELKATAEGFEMYEADHLKLPYESPTAPVANSPYYVPPPGMELYLPKNSTWKNGTNGSWLWFYWPGALPPFKGFVYLMDPNITDDDIAYIDKQIDDGNPYTGSIINYGGGQILYGIQ